MNIESELARLRPAPVDVEDAVVLATGLAEGYRRYESPVGAVIVTFNPLGVSSVMLTEDVETSSGRQPRIIAAIPPSGWDKKIGRAIEEGTPRDLPLDLHRVGPFQRQILELTATIPKGEVRPYGWLAKEAGSPNAVRAVGTAMARNPVPLIVPCHRVIRSDGAIGNYSLGGRHNKILLLEREGHDLDRIAHYASKGVRFLASQTTGVYCLPSCRTAAEIDDDRRVELRSSREAADAGYRPCDGCRP